MSYGVNKVTLLGNLGDEPLFRQTNSGLNVANASLCTSSYFTDQSGQKVEQSEWHRLVFWGKIAELAHEYLHKGSQIYCEGKLQTRTFTGKDNIQRSVTEIIVSEMKMLDKVDRRNGNNTGNANSNAYGNNTGAKANGNTYNRAYNNNAGGNSNGNTYAKNSYGRQNVYNNAQGNAPVAPNRAYNSQQTQAPQNTALPEQTVSALQGMQSIGDDLPF